MYIYICIHIIFVYLLDLEGSSGLAMAYRVYETRRVYRAYVLCFMFYVLCFMFYVLCFMFYVLCFMVFIGFAGSLGFIGFGVLGKVH